jgi:polyketide biosynthesis enoyl-CoA hydratase PksH
LNYATIKVTFQDPVCFIQFDRPAAKNTINSELIAECHDAISSFEDAATVMVLSGSPEVFCLGADFNAIARDRGVGNDSADAPGRMYDLWQRLAMGPYISVSHVRGTANAGGVGFVAASDIVLAGDKAQFGLSELLFGLFPACVLPFLVRRVGWQRAHYMTVTTQPLSAERACDWGLVDAVDKDSDDLLRRHLLRLRRLSKTAIRRYKAYIRHLGSPLSELRAPAVAANLEIFSDPSNLEGVARYVEHGLFPWEKR